MNSKFVFTYFILILILLSCDNSVSDSNTHNESSTELSIGNNINNSIQIKKSISGYNAIK